MPYQIIGDYEKNYRDSHTPSELWDEATETWSPNARYHSGCECWIYKKGAVIPSYMQVEIERGRIVQIGEAFVKEGK